MKATHIGRVNDIEHLFNNWVQDHNKFSVQFLLDVAGKNYDLTLESNGMYTVLGYEDWRLNENDLTDLREIKPEIEIPKCPFWVRLNDGSVRKFDKTISPNNVFDYKVILDSGLSGNEYYKESIEELLNNDTWTICDEPKKEMRAWNDEELITYLMDTGWFTQGKRYFYPSTIDIEEGKVFFVDECEECTHEPLSMIIKNYTDRHGNKFEKEVEK